MDPHVAAKNTRLIAEVTEAPRKDESELNIVYFNPKLGFFNRAPPQSSHSETQSKNTVETSSLKRNWAVASDEPEYVRSSPRVKTAKLASDRPWSANSVPIGYWKDSTAPEPHAVTAFIDKLQRLRFRIERSTVSGVGISHEHLMPPGPTGRLTALDRVVLRKRLVCELSDKIKGYDFLTNGDGDFEGLHQIMANQLLICEIREVIKGYVQKSLNDTADIDGSALDEGAASQASGNVESNKRVPAPPHVTSGAADRNLESGEAERRPGNGDERSDNNLSVTCLGGYNAKGVFHGLPGTQRSPINAMIHSGVEYRRQSRGPLTGNLVSQGTIFTIKGEDYVEYRVLTKPSFC
ncbi:hypothetical protein FDECE_11086 [Fusarium decemcellulare]|nr:hypothetical protein FDECE_11086 [Fusarium decemcellulare]